MRCLVHEGQDLFFSESHCRFVLNQIIGWHNCDQDQRIVSVGINAHYETTRCHDLPIIHMASPLVAQLRVDIGA
jgi:hypothetical protein